MLDFCLMNIRVSKQFTFEMAHALHGYEGPCKNIHGHSYQLTVCLIGQPVSEKTSENGMVIDFGNLKKIVNEKIIHEFDHSLVLNNTYPFQLPLNEAFGKVHFVDFQPTCENLLVEFKNRLSSVNFNGAILHSILLRETNSSFAEWYLNDN